jgi:antitoxin HicB
MDKDLQYYLGLPYKILLYPSPEGGFAIEMPELPGCISQGETIEEAYEMIRDAQKCWLEVALEDDNPIPEPAATEEYSGKFNVRVPKSLHRALAEKAKEEKVSLNQLIVYQLARGVGYKL